MIAIGLHAAASMTGSGCVPQAPSLANPRAQLVEACSQVLPGFEGPQPEDYPLEAALDEGALGGSIHVRDATLLWALRPSLAPRARPPGAPHPILAGAWRIASDSHGLAEPEVSLPPHPRVFRLLCLGDATSLPFGPEVDTLDPWPRRLEDALNRHYPSAKIEVVNASVPGYSTTQMRRAIELWRERLGTPSVLLLATGLHDASTAPVPDTVLLGLEDPPDHPLRGRRVSPDQGVQNVLRTIAAGAAGVRGHGIPGAVVLPWSMPRDQDGLLRGLLLACRTREIPLFLGWTASSAASEGAPAHETIPRRSQGFLVPRTLSETLLTPTDHQVLADRLAVWVEHLPVFRRYLHRLD